MKNNIPERIKRVLLAIVVVFWIHSGYPYVSIGRQSGRTCGKDCDGGSHGGGSYRYLGCSISW